MGTAGFVLFCTRSAHLPGGCSRSNCGIKKKYSSANMSVTGKKKIKDEVLAEYREVFATFDIDGGGSIDTSELGNVMRSLGLNPTRDDVIEMVAEVDVNGDGEIDFDEFCTMMEKFKEDDDSDDSDWEMRAAFDAFDADGGGTISLKELGDVMKSMGENLTHEEIEEMIREADIDGDGEIDYEEFKKMMDVPSEDELDDEYSVYSTEKDGGSVRGDP